jgi:hypothetical protein
MFSRLPVIHSVPAGAVTTNHFNSGSEDGDRVTALNRHAIRRQAFQEALVVNGLKARQGGVEMAHTIQQSIGEDVLRVRVRRSGVRT